MSRRVLITCSRSFRDWSAARAILTAVHAEVPDAVLVHGDCERGDRQIAGIWKSLGGVDDPMAADWPSCGTGCPQRAHRKTRARTGEEYCPFAGLRRDEEMVETAPDRVLAFLDPESRTKGAFRTAEMAEAAGIPTVRYPVGAS